MGESVETRNFEWVTEFDGDLASPSSGRGRRKSKPKKKEFVGWGSVQLIEFLESIGKTTTEALSHFDVTSIINQYISQNGLINPAKKRRVQCDERLFALFGKKSIGKIKVHDLLEEHFVENQDDSEDSDMGGSGDVENECTVNKQKKVSASCAKTLEKKTKTFEVPKSCFAAVKPENIKLVYLRRSLVQNLLKDPEAFERKVVGCFVRVKSDPLDYLQKNSYQIQLVKGVTKVTSSGNDVLLEISDMAKDVKISELSEDDFSEAEFNDLSQKIKDGILKKLIVVDLQQKAQLLHEDITKHWLAREIPRLQKLIDRANEKGWRREMFEYRETKKLLETPAEQSRLLQEVPQVIAEELKMDISSVLEPQIEVKAADPLVPMDLVETTPADHHMDWVETKPAVPHVDMVDTKPVVPHLDWVETKTAPPHFDWVESATPAVPHFDWVESTPALPDLEWEEMTPAVPYLGKKNIDNASRSAHMVGLNRSKSNGVLENSNSTDMKFQGSELVKDELEGTGISRYMMEAHSNGQPQPSSLTRTMSPQAAGSTKKKEPEIIDIDTISSDPPQLLSQKMTASHQAAGFIKKEPVIITIDDDDDDEAGDMSNSTSPDDEVWHYKDPQGNVQGPFSMDLFRRWDERNYFAPDFRVWKASQSSEEAVLLSEALLQMFPPSKA